MKNKPWDSVYPKNDLNEHYKNVMFIDCDSEKKKELFSWCHHTLGPKRAKVSDEYVNNDFKCDMAIREEEIFVPLTNPRWGRGSPPMYQFIYYYDHVVFHKTVYKFSFRFKRDAVLFKMVWG